MAAVVGTLVAAAGFGPPVGPPLPSPVGNKMLTAIVQVTFPSGTYVQGASAANFTPATLIQSERNNGKTVTIRTAAFISPGSENGVTVTAQACAVSTGTVSCQLYGADQTTEHAAAAMNAVWTRPVSFLIAFTEPV